jgi:O-antigen/teichoic acid export membrane protein
MLRVYLSNTLGLTVIQGSSLLIPVLLIPIIVRVGGVEAYGQYATVLAYYSFAALICDFGFDYSAVRELKNYEGEPEERARIIRETLSAKCVLFAAAAPFAAFTLVEVGGINDTPLVVSGLLIPAASVFSVQWLYLAEGKLVHLSIPVTVARVASLVGIFVCFPRLPSIALAVAITAVPVLGVQCLFWVTEVKQMQGKRSLSLPAAVRGISKGFTGFSITFLSSCIAMSSVVVVSAVAGPREVGVFAAVEKIAKAAFGIAKPFLVALYPEMSSLFRRSRAQWRRVIRRVVIGALAIGALSVLGIVVGWTWLSAALLGHGSPESRLIAYAFAVWLCIGVINNALGIQGLIASGNERQYQRALGIAVFLLTTGYVTLGVEYGVVGVLGALLIAETSLLGLNARAFSRLASSGA